MCSKQECVLRQESKEISFFEATKDSATKPPNQWKLDPSRAVQKYRRSAAGSKHTTEPRSIEQLRTTVRYLVEILVTQLPLHSTMSVLSRQSLVKTVSFVEDRFRAVQVDLVRSQQTSADLQLILIRAQILILYLTLDLTPRQYARKLGCDALTSALGAYWQSLTAEEEDHSSVDEVLALKALLGIAEYFEAWWTFGPDHQKPLLSPSVVLHYRRRRPRRHQSKMDSEDSSRFQWTLSLITHVQSGHWRVALDQLYACEHSFGVLARCILAPAVPHMRYQALLIYNACFWGKAGSITGNHLAALLCMHRDDNEESQQQANPKEKEAESRCGAEAFALAKNYGIATRDDGVLFKMATAEPYARPDALRLDPFCLELVNEGGFRSKEYHTDFRVDDDGVKLPNATWMRDLILGRT